MASLQMGRLGRNVSDSFIILGLVLCKGFACLCAEGACYAGAPIVNMFVNGGGGNQVEVDGALF